jgi:hypothetical protein
MVNISILDFLNGLISAKKFPNGLLKELTLNFKLKNMTEEKFSEIAEFRIRLENKRVARNTLMKFLDLDNISLCISYSAIEKKDNVTHRINDQDFISRLIYEELKNLEDQIFTMEQRFKEF